LFYFLFLCWLCRIKFTDHDSIFTTVTDIHHLPSTPLHLFLGSTQPVNHFTCTSTWFQSCFNQASYFSHLHKQDRAANFLCIWSIITISFITMAGITITHHPSISKPASTTSQANQFQIQIPIPMPAIIPSIISPFSQHFSVQSFN
jgi:hypothetical protein